MKDKFIDFYMKIAESTSQLSSAVRLKVGSVIVKGNSIISYGYNGTPTGWDNNCEYREYPPRFGIGNGEYNDFGYDMIDEDDKTYRLKTKPEVLHSEANAILKVARSTESSEGATLFCTHAPCIDCAKLIYQAGISTVYYRDQYRSRDGIEFLEKSNIPVIHYTHK
jgi:dCMP deaminase